MPSLRRASVISAFLVGASSPIPFLAFGSIGIETFVGRSVASMLFLLYLVSVFLFVFGPQRWETWYCIPVDGYARVLSRCAVWLFGGLLSIAALEHAGRNLTGGCSGP